MDVRKMHQSAAVAGIGESNGNSRVIAVDDEKGGSSGDVDIHYSVRLRKGDLVSISNFHSHHNERCGRNGDANRVGAGGSVCDEAIGHYTVGSGGVCGGEQILVGDGGSDDTGCDGGDASGKGHVIGIHCDEGKRAIDGIIGDIYGSDDGGIDDDEDRRVADGDGDSVGQDEGGSGEDASSRYGTGEGSCGDEDDASFSGVGSSDAGDRDCDKSGGGGGEGENGDRDGDGGGRGDVGGDSGSGCGDVAAGSLSKNAARARDVQSQRKDSICKEVAIDAGDNLNEAVEPATTFYAAKKTVAQGMMDIALITSNANQLRYLLEFGAPSPVLHFNLALVSLSLLLQIAVGLALVWKGRLDLRGEEEEQQQQAGDARKRRRADALADAIVVGVFLITVINVFMAAFAIGGATASSRVLD